MPDNPLEVRWLKRAAASLEREADFIARDDPAAAERAVLAIVRTVERLAQQPALGRTGRVSGTRELVVPGTPYIVPYRVREGRVEGLHVFHAARRWPVGL